MGEVAVDGLTCTLDDWIASEAFSFSIDSGALVAAAVDRIITALDGQVVVLGLGEALHGGEALLELRNRLFSRLAEAHGFSAIAVESDYLRARLVDDYVAGKRTASLGEVCEAGFSHGFGQLEANRELVEQMREYNRDPSHSVPLRFYGFDSPTEMSHAESPRDLITVPLDYLDSLGHRGGDELRRAHLLALVGDDARWTNPAAMMDPSQSVGLSPGAMVLRARVEDLVMELELQRPGLADEDEIERHREALFCAESARRLLCYHAEAARASEAGRRIVRMLGMRDAMMAANLAHIVEREESRGRVLVFAHNSHLSRERAEWQLGPHHLAWWPAGAHLNARFGASYAVIGSGVAVSEENGIGVPEAGTLEARLLRAPNEAVFVSTRGARPPSGAALAGLLPRSRSRRNSTYFPLTPGSIEGFDGLVVVGSTAYARGGPPLPPSDPSTSR